ADATAFFFGAAFGFAAAAASASSRSLSSRSARRRAVLASRAAASALMMPQAAAVVCSALLSLVTDLLMRGLLVSCGAAAPKGGRPTRNAKKGRRPGPPLYACPCQYIRGHGSARSLRGLKVLGRVLARAGVAHDVERHLLALDEGAQARALDRGDVNEHVRLAAALLDEAEALGGIEEFYGTSVHDDILFHGHECPARVNRGRCVIDLKRKLVVRLPARVTKFNSRSIADI